MPEGSTVSGEVAARVVRLFARLWVVGLVLAAVMILLARWWWVGECASHWHLHLLVLGLIPAVIVRGWWLVALLVAAMVFVAPVVVPGPSPLEAAPAVVEPLRVLSANVGWFNDRHADLEAVFANWQPDVLGVVELSPALAERLRPMLPHRYEVVGEELGAFGSGIYSRLPIAVTRAHHVGGTEVLDVTLRSAAGPLRLLLLHPPPPIGARGFAQRRDLLIAVADLAAGSAVPIVVMGDFNCSPASPAWRPLLKLGELRPADHQPRTWPAPVAQFGIAIDHILAGPGLAIGDLTPLDLPGSDHRGLTALLRSGP